MKNSRSAQARDWYRQKQKKAEKLANATQDDTERRTTTHDPNNPAQTDNTLTADKTGERPKPPEDGWQTVKRRKTGQQRQTTETNKGTEEKDIQATKTDRNYVEKARPVLDQPKTKATENIEIDTGTDQDETGKTEGHQQTSEDGNIDMKEATDKNPNHHEHRA